MKPPGNALLAEPEVQSARTAIARKWPQSSGPGSKYRRPTCRWPKSRSSRSKRRQWAVPRLDRIHGDVLLAVEARFELAELLAQRHDHDEALKLLGDVLDKNRRRS